jgi:hypothetical protein
MSELDRRQFLKGLLGALAQGTGTILLASAAARAARGEQALKETEIPPPDQDVQRRADQLAAAWTRSEENAVAANEFLNVGWSPGWRNGGWPNGVWRNGHWRNGGWRNAGWRNGSWRNGGWRNGSWPNGAWRNSPRR